MPVGIILGWEGNIYKQYTTRDLHGNEKRGNDHSMAKTVTLITITKVANIN